MGHAETEQMLLIMTWSVTARLPVHASRRVCMKLAYKQSCCSDNICTCDTWHRAERQWPKQAACCMHSSRAADPARAPGRARAAVGVRGVQADRLLQPGGEAERPDVVGHGALGAPGRAAHTGHAEWCMPGMPSGACRACRAVHAERCMLSGAWAAGRLPQPWPLGVLKLHHKRLSV